ncbi:FtsH protease activity modulator HflK [Ideonella dechloratans]|uniref:Protein HflK n=2 Tax=Ideonella dechloratans TaxID=36863 RepID=A0A643FDI7_IDEDE|nr:FtsH protease activity modulator HflK [Ideonella dechloratans]KAB0579965.1 FtsH protease activity modulator HflK [Ideonella dechloratans]UFU08869.1 FtsH protease activity modulator HflK [Ideonella dechloratans]
MTMRDHTLAPPSWPLRLSALTLAARDLLRGGWARLRGATVSLNNGRNDGPPDLDELWRDFNRKLSGLFGGKPSGPSSPESGGPGNFQPDMKSAGKGVALIAGVVALIWLGSGAFIVQEGHQAVITTFGRYSTTLGAGFQWRLPYPFQAHEIVPVTQLRSVEVGGTGVVPATGLRDSSMLTQDENIVDIRFTVQYTLKDARAFLFENRDTEQAVVQAAESAVREIVGRSKVDGVLYERRDAIAAELAQSIQNQLDRLNAGVSIKNVNLQNVQVPEQVQAAFDDAVKAGADRDRFKNEGQAYASDVIPKAQGTAARLLEEAQGYKSRVVAQAEGDSQRFLSVYREYQKAPAVTRDRLYIDTMREVYSNVSKVMVDTRSSSPMLYLPLDKLIQQSGSGMQAPAAGGATPSSPPAVSLPDASTGTVDSRSRDSARTRDRETR